MNELPIIMITDPNYISMKEKLEKKNIFRDVHNKKYSDVEDYFNVNHKCQKEYCDYKKLDYVKYENLKEHNERQIVYKGSCGNIHVCGKGGCIISPCDINMDILNSKGKIVCDLTDQTTELPPSCFFENPSNILNMKKPSRYNLDDFICNINKQIGRKKVAQFKTTRQNKNSKSKMNWLDVKTTISPFSGVIHKECVRKNIRKNNNVRSRNIRNKNKNKRSNIEYFLKNKANNQKNFAFFKRKNLNEIHMNTITDRKCHLMKSDLHSGFLNIPRNFNHITFDQMLKRNIKLLTHHYDRLKEIDIKFMLVKLNINDANEHWREKKILAMSLLQYVVYENDTDENAKLNKLDDSKKKEYEILKNNLTEIIKKSAFDVDIITYRFVTEMLNVDKIIHLERTSKKLRNQNLKCAFLLYFSRLCWIHWIMIRYIIETDVNKKIKNNKNYKDFFRENHSQNMTERKSKSNYIYNYSLFCMSMIYDLKDGLEINNTKIIPKIQFFESIIPPFNNTLVVKNELGFRKKELTNITIIRREFYNFIEKNQKMNVVFKINQEKFSW